MRLSLRSKQIVYFSIMTFNGFGFAILATYARTMWDVPLAFGLGVSFLILYVGWFLSQGLKKFWNKDGSMRYD